MEKLEKQEIEKITESILIQLSEKDGVPKEVCLQTLQAINNPIDFDVFCGIFSTLIRPSVLSEKERHMKTSICGIIQLGYDIFIEKIYDENDEKCQITSDLENELKKNDINTMLNSLKMQYAINQFVKSFSEFDLLKQKYPELMKQI